MKPRLAVAPGWPRRIYNGIANGLLFSMIGSYAGFFIGVALVLPAYMVCPTALRRNDLGIVLMGILTLLGDLVGFFWGLAYGMRENVPPKLEYPPAT